MKRNVIILVLALFTLWVGVSTAQETNSGAADNQAMQAQPEHGGHHGSPEMRVKHMTKELNLNADQQSKVLAILQDQQKQMEAAHNDTSMSQQDRHSKMMDLHKSANEQIRAVLNPDQQKKFDAMSQHEAQHMGHHGDWNKSGQQTPPPQQ